MTSIQERVRPPIEPAIQQVDTWITTDDELLGRVHEGDAAAFAELYERHHHDAYQYARRLSRRYLNGDAAEDVLAEAVRKVLTALRGGSGPTTGFRRYLFTAIRSVTFTERSGPQTDDNEPPATMDAPSADERIDTLVVMSAFSSLPERWRQVLWATEVTDLAPSEVARVLGLRANSVAALAGRAREALRIAYVRAHLPRGKRPQCHDALDLIARRTALLLTPMQATRLGAHLTSCDHCYDAAWNIQQEIVSWGSSWRHMRAHGCRVPG